ncbi:ribosome maturation factor RimM [Francisellaceae bacterium]|nr:ribosome maturation factor RimM [Francisellaceae bacterium]
MAKIGSPHALGGDMVLHYYTDSMESLLKYSIWFIKLKNCTNWSPLSSEEVYRVGSKIIIKLPDANTREQAIKYVDAEIGVLRSEFPDLKDEYYWLDLIGCDVIDQESQYLGKVDSLIETGANDVLVIKGDHEILIPFVSNYVLDVDINKKCIKVYWEEDFN